MNFLALQTLFYDKALQESGNTDYAASKVKKWLNEGYKKILNFHTWQFLKKEQEQAVVFTECSDVGDSVGTTLYVDSSAGMQVGMKLWVTDGSNYERVEIASISGNTITLVSPGLYHTYEDSDDVSSANIFLPFDCKNILGLKILDLSSSDQSGKLLKFNDSFNMGVNVPYPKSSSQPTHYWHGGVNQTKESGLVAGAGSGVGSIKAVVMHGAEDDYYKGWRVVNTSRNLSARVSSSSYSSPNNELTLDTDITAQVATDQFYIVRDLPEVFLYPIPDANSYRLRFAYTRRINDLVNDYDEPCMGIRGEEYHWLIVEWALYVGLMAGENPMAMAHRDTFTRGLREFKEAEIYPHNRMINLRLGSSSDLPGFYYDER